MLRLHLIIGLIAILFAFEGSASSNRKTEQLNSILDRYLEEVRETALKQLTERMRLLESMQNCAVSMTDGTPCSVIISHLSSTFSEHKLKQPFEGRQRNQKWTSELRTKDELLKLVREQVVQYRMNTILASPSTLFRENAYLMASTQGPAQDLRLQADEGLLPIVVSHNGVEMNHAISLMRRDLESVYLFMLPLMRLSPNSSEKAEFANLLKSSRNCNRMRDCVPLNSWQALITPFYQMNARALVESFPYLQTIASRPASEVTLSRLRRALEKNVSEIQATVQALRKLTGHDRTLLLAFVSANQSLLTQKNAEEKKLIAEAVTNFKNQQTIWTEFRRQASQLSFLSVVACYTSAAVTVSTPLVTVLPTLCHALGLGVAGTNLVSAWGDMRRSLSLLKLQQIRPEVHHATSLAFASEAAFALLYAQAVIPHFYRNQGLGIGTFASTGATSQRSLVDRKLIDQATGQFVEILQKLGIARFANLLATRELDLSFLFSDEVYSSTTNAGHSIHRSDWMPVHEMFFNVMTTPVYTVSIAGLAGPHIRIPTPDTLSLPAVVEHQTIMKAALEEIRAHNRSMIEDLARVH